METEIQHYSDLAIPPGEYLLEASADLGLNQADLARRMGRPVQAISAYTVFIKNGIFTAQSILSFAKSIGIAPGVVTGRLQHDGHIGQHCHIHREQYTWIV